MNFLLHHHLALRDLGSPAAAVGAMLPDLWRMADRRVRASVAPVAAAADPALAAVLAGVDHHLVADRWFHHDPVFTGGEGALLGRLRGAGLRAGRLPLFAHVLWELCLDGELVRRVGLGTILGGLRAGFAVAFEAPAARAADLHHFARVARSREERAAFDHRLGRIAAELVRGPWIEGYQDGEGLAARLEGVRSRLGLAPLAEDDRRGLAGVLDATLGEAPAAVDRILGASLTGPSPQHATPAPRAEVGASPGRAPLA